MNDVDEKALWERYKEKGDAAARDKLLVKHMRTVKYIAGRMAIHVPNSVEMDDLVGWGVLGLLDAVEKYDHKQDIKFSTYASIRVRGAIIDEIRSLDWAPRSLRATARKLGAARDKLRHAHGHDPSVEDLASETGLTSEQVEEATGGAAPQSSGKQKDRLDGRVVGNVSEQKLGKAKFRAVYYYDAAGLAQITMNRRSGSCESVISALIDRFGEPTEMHDQVILRTVTWLKPGESPARSSR